MNPPGTGLTFARGTVPTPRGEISVAWHRPAGGAPFTLDVTIPPNTAAAVAIPGGAAAQLGAGTYHVEGKPGT